MELDNSINLIDSFIGNEQTINYLYKYKKEKLNTNLFIFGNHGSGKTFLSKILIKFLDKKSLYINFLDIKSQNDLLTKINFFSNQKFNKNLLIIIDDIDTFSKNIQNNLISIIQKYNKNITFIFICENTQILIENLKNKFIFLHLNDISDDLIFDYLKKYVNKNNIKICDNNIEYIINISSNNVYNSIINLQKYNLVTSKNNNIYDIFFLPSFEIYNNLFNICKKNNIFNLILQVEKLYNNNYSYYDNLTNLFNFIKKYNEIDQLKKIEIIKIIGIAFTIDAPYENNLIHMVYIFTKIFLIINDNIKIENK